MPSSQTPPLAGPPAGAGETPAGSGPGHGLRPRGGLLRRLEARDIAVSAVVAGRWPHPRCLTVPLGAISLTGNYGVVWVVLAAVGARQTERLFAAPSVAHADDDFGLAFHGC